MSCLKTGQCFHYLTMIIIMSVLATNWVLFSSWVTSLSVGNFDILTWGQEQIPLHVKIEICDISFWTFLTLSYLKKRSRIDFTFVFQIYPNSFKHQKYINVESQFMKVIFQKSNITIFDATPPPCTPHFPRDCSK